MEIKEADCSQTGTIRAIANIAFPITYREILSPEQMEYMMEMMYGEPSLRQQIEADGHRFLLLWKTDERQAVGFVSFESGYQREAVTKIHKLYLLPACKGKGYGRLLVEAVFKRAKAEGDAAVRLNMNRNNPSFGFYKRLGFEIIREEDIDIGNGFLMEDYVFEKRIV